MSIFDRIFKKKSTKVDNQVSTTPQNQRQNNPVPPIAEPIEISSQIIESLPEFPLIDDKGMNQLKMLDNVRLSGVTKEHDGINPQEIIPCMEYGEEVFFKRPHMKRYPNAVLVVNSLDEPIGWIPEDFCYQEDIAKRLDDGTTVKGSVSDILGGEDDEYYGITIDILRYGKPRQPKSLNIDPDPEAIKKIESRAKREVSKTDDKGYFYENIAIDFEKIGAVQEAIKYYELSLSENFNGGYPYQRLAIIYRKLKRYDDEIRISKIAENLFEKDECNQNKENWFAKRVEKAELLKSK